MKQPSILQLLDYADPENVGGASRVAFSLGRELARMGWRGTVLAGCAGRHGATSLEGFTLINFPSLPSERRKRFDNLCHLWRPWRELRRAKPARHDVILAHQPFVTWAVRRALAGAPLMYYFHSPWPREYEARRRGRAHGSRLQVGLRTVIERWALARARLVLVSSRYMRRVLLDIHPDKRLARKIQIQPHGVDTEHFSPQGPRAALRAALRWPHGEKVLVTCRRLEDRMGLEQLIEALALCRESCPGIMLVIAGKGRLEANLKALAARLRLADRVRFVGYVPDDVLPRLYSAADLFVLPTQELEGFGLVTLEALACNLPVVATPVGAIPEVLGPLSPGLLCAGTDPRALAARIREVLARMAQGFLAGDLCRRFVLAQYSWRKTAEQFACRVEDLAAQRPEDEAHPPIETPGT